MRVRKIELETIVGSFCDAIRDDDYVVYGHNDRIRMSLLDNSDNYLPPIYNDVLKITDGLIQKFYFLYDDNLEQKEFQFWINAKKENFCGIYFITLCDKQKENSLKECINLSDSKERLFFYNTLDDYDLVLTCYGNNFYDIEDTIAKLFNMNNIYIKDSYSLFITSYSRLNNMCKNTNDTISYKIQVSIKNSISHNQIKNFLKEIYNLPNLTKIKNISGSQNIMLLFIDSTVEELYSLYKTTEGSVGIFSITSIYRDTILKSTHLKFLCDINENYYKYYKDNSKNKLNDIFEIREINDYNIDEFYMMQIRRICNSLTNIYNRGLADFTLLSLYFSLKKFLQKLYIVKDYPYRNKISSIELYLQTCREVLNINNSTQIGYYPKQEYFSKEAYIPSKLLCFYTAFLFEMTKIVINVDNEINNINYNKKSVDYTFCIKPSFKGNVAISCIFMTDNNVNDRLLLVDIPMKYIYNQDIMLFSLCHEASHYNGEIVRCRKERADYILNIIFNYLYNVLLDHISINDDIYKFRTYLNNVFTNKFNDHIKNYENRYYSNTIKEVLYITLFDILIDISFSMKSYFDFLNNNNISIITDNTVKNSPKDFIDFIGAIKNNARNLLFKDNFMKFVFEIIDLFSETYSDFFAIKFLEVEFKSYNKNILTTYGVNSFEEIKSGFIIIRILTLYLSVYKNNFNIDKLNPSFQKIIKTFDNYLVAKPNTMFKGLVNGDLGDPMILNCLIEYIKECDVKFNQYFCSQKSNKNMNDIKTMIKSNYFDIDILNKYNNMLRKYVVHDIKNI